MIGTQPAAPPQPWRPPWAVLGSGVETLPGPPPCPGTLWTADVSDPAPVMDRPTRAWFACTRAIGHDGRCRS